MTIEAEYRAHVAGPWCDIQGHLPFLYRAVSQRPGAVVVELGVNTGMSTRALLAGAHKSGSQVWSCDIAEALVPMVVSHDQRWHFLLADDLSPEAKSWLPDQCDVLFLDAHSGYWDRAKIREHLLAELHEYGPRVRAGGVILAHDTQWEPPGHDLGEPTGGVALALDDYCKETGRTWRNRPGHFGLGIIPAQGVL